MTGNLSAPPNDRRIVVTVQGIDRVGIVARFSQVLADADANLTDISQSVLHGDLFVMVAVADLSPEGSPFEALRQALTDAGETLGVAVQVQREEIFRAMHRI